ncbi:hypothetical protein [Microbacterium sp. H83]|uniref:hypothetical protein n=1 Tax=Microbacterium sp. H83 TaxID=1827324 RepID=UPI0007F52356|nr:hypothetical protein [Microbacterium sp. H83]OAN40186.1 hypothetical protein A4X16_13270 [Microbacterium sp. H83]
MVDAEERTSAVLWACVEEGFHVGSRGGDFLGYVDRQPDGAHRAFDAHSALVGDYSTLHEATAAVVAAADGRTGRPDSRTDDLQGKAQ